MLYKVNVNKFIALRPVFFYLLGGPSDQAAAALMCILTEALRCCQITQSRCMRRCKTRFLLCSKRYVCRGIWAEEVAVFIYFGKHFVYIKKKIPAMIYSSTSIDVNGEIGFARAYELKWVWMLGGAPMSWQTPFPSFFFFWQRFFHPHWSMRIKKSVPFIFFFQPKGWTEKKISLPVCSI